MTTIRYWTARLLPALVTATLLFCSLDCLAEAGSHSDLPDAPVPQPAVMKQDASTQANTMPPPRKVWVATPWSQWTPYVSPGERTTPLTRREQANFWLHLEFRPLAALPALASGFYGVAINDDPKYGTNADAFGKRLGAAAIREASMRFFVGTAVPLVTGEDPRYYRAGSGSIWHRSMYAVGASFVHRKEDGRRTVNTADLFGHALACALIPAYYPARSANGRVVAQSWVTSIGGDAVNNLFLEFWPSVVHHFRMRHEQKEMEQEQK